MKIKLSKAQWQTIGKKQGWMKTADVKSCTINGKYVLAMPNPRTVEEISDSVDKGSDTYYPELAGWFESEYKYLRERYLELLDAVKDLASTDLGEGE